MKHEDAVKLIQSVLSQLKLSIPEHNQIQEAFKLLCEGAKKE